MLQFQSTVVERDDVRKLLASINAGDEEHELEEGRLNQIFDVWWPQLETALEKIPSDDSAESTETGSSPIDLVTPPGAEILEEVLELVRQQHRLLNSPDSLLPEDYLNHIMRRVNRQNRILRPHPAFDDLAKRFESVSSMIEAFEGQKTIPTGVVQDMIEKLRHPVEYLTEKYGHRRRRFALRAQHDLPIEDD